MAYSPRLDYYSSCTLRRIAWALHTPMTGTLEEILRFLPFVIKGEAVCESCKDRTKCDECVFHVPGDDVSFLKDILRPQAVELCEEKDAS